jgi:uncharacterized protein (DUF427 family)
VWDYPRPPRLEPTDDHVVVVLGGMVIIDTVQAVRVLETSHPPAYYLPVADIIDGVLRAAPGSSYCEFKGHADYFDLVSGRSHAQQAAWGYANPTSGFDALVDRISLYPARMDVVTVNGEAVRAQEGGFYGGWITDRVVGPFKGGPGTRGW